MVAGVFLREGRVLCCRRPPGRSAAGLWEFPGGKVEPGEDHAGALVRELAEELGVEVVVTDLVDRTSTAVAGATVDLVVHLVEPRDDWPRSSLDHDRMAWVRVADLDGLDWAEPDWPAVRILMANGVAGDGR